MFILFIVGFFLDKIFFKLFLKKKIIRFSYRLVYLQSGGKSVLDNSHNLMYGQEQHKREWVWNL